MKLSNFKITNKGLYWGLIATFALLYVFVGFVSTLHSITFFNLANTMGLAILLGVTYEIGQASVLFSILMSESNRNKFLPWALMFLLTALQVTANVYASFKFMAASGSMDWQYWQKSILIGVQASNPEMYQIIISWIAGALLPIVALGMTALVAQNMNFLNEENKIEPEKVGSVSDEEVDKVINDEVNKRVASLIDTAKIADLEKPSELVMPIEQVEPLIDPEFGPVDLTNEEPDKLVRDYYKEDASKYLDENAEYLTPIKNINVQLDEAEAKEIDQLVELNIKKPGRPPKQKETVSKSKKEKELLPKEENVKAPLKPTKTKIFNPLKVKSTSNVVKDLEEIIKPSKGDEVIKLIENLDKIKTEESFTSTEIGDQSSQETPLSPSGIPYLEGGVEVIDAKAIPLPQQVKKN